MNSNNEQNLSNDLNLTTNLAQTANNLHAKTNAISSSNSESQDTVSTKKTGKEFPLIFKIAFKDRTEYSNFSNLYYKLSL